MSSMEIISGTVRHLKITKTYEKFLLNKREKNVVGIASIAASGIGEAFTSASDAGSGAGGEIDVEFFTCTIDEVSLSGQFHKVEFQAGETIEFVVERDGKDALAHAARSPAQRMLWMSPYQSRGVVAQKKSDVKWTIITTALGVLLIVAMDFYFSPGPVDDEDYGRWFMFPFFFILFLTMNIFIRKKFKMFSVHATEILQVFEYKNPSEVDLNVLHREAQRKIKQETGKLPPLAQPWSFRY